MGLLYVYDGVVGSRDAEWLQGALNVIIIISAGTDW